MERAVVLTYDGSFEGFLTCVFTVFEQKLEVISINPGAGIQQDFFSSPEIIITDLEKAERVKGKERYAQKDFCKRKEVTKFCFFKRTTKDRVVNAYLH